MWTVEMLRACPPKFQDVGDLDAFLNSLTDEWQERVREVIAEVDHGDQYGFPVERKDGTWIEVDIALGPAIKLTEEETVAMMNGEPISPEREKFLDDDESWVPRVMQRRHAPELRLVSAN